MLKKITYLVKKLVKYISGAYLLRLLTCRFLTAIGFIIKYCLHTSHSTPYMRELSGMMEMFCILTWGMSYTEVCIFTVNFSAKKWGWGVLLEKTEVTARGLSSYSPAVKAGILTCAEHRMWGDRLHLTPCGREASLRHCGVWFFLLSTWPSVPDAPHGRWSSAWRKGRPILNGCGISAIAPCSLGG